MRVLVIEDETRLASTLQDLLELNGYAADVCHDGEAGLDNALTAIYDVIILDVMLPKMDGSAPSAGGGKRRSGADAYGPFGGLGQGSGPGLRRGLLPHKAL